MNPKLIRELAGVSAPKLCEEITSGAATVAAVARKIGGELIGFDSSWIFLVRQITVAAGWLLLTIWLTQASRPQQW